MFNFPDGKNNFFSMRSLDLFQASVLNPQIAMLSFLKVGQQLASQPKKIEKSQQDLLNRLLELQKEFVKELCDSKDGIINLKYDAKEQKFNDDVFEKNPMLIFARKFYDMTSSWLTDTLESIENVDPKIMHSARFFMKQYINMLSPNNFPFLNPNFLKKTLQTNGENIQKGIEMLLEDIRSGYINTNDRSKFKVGENLANTPGKVVYQNEIIELIQYAPTTEKVFSKPILFVPPWINKFYILDLNSEMSLVKWAVDNGFTVFMISWVNPDKSHREKGFGEYIVDGLMESLDKIFDITKSKSVHSLGYCVGGTLIAILLAYLKNPLCKRQPKAKIETATLLTTLLDFEHSGDMAIFMADSYLEAINAQMEEKGFLEGQVMFNTFSTLKSNDMIWRYFINSYMLGNKPAPHEILFWNSDHTNISEAMQKFLSIDLYRDNLLSAGKLKIFGVPIDLKLITTPIYMISMHKDHLVPWKATFNSLKMFSKGVRFVLGGSGHVAGAINPPSRGKYCYWINNNDAKSAEDWINDATEIAGSWWKDWLEWIKPLSGEMHPALQITNFLRDAPGIYVHRRSE